MREIQTEIIINAPIEKAWSILTDFSSYPTWNPFIRSISGIPRMNEKLTVTIAPPNKKSMTFRPKILSLSKHELIWEGKLGITGIFDGVHRFLLLPLSNNTIKFIHSEKFSGLFHIPIFNLINESTKEVSKK